MLKQKVGELEGLKAFYLTQVQALRTLAHKHTTDGTYPISQPTMPEEVARLLMTLHKTDCTGSPGSEDLTGGHRGHPPPQSHHTTHPSSKQHHDNDASDGLSARLHEPSGGMAHRDGGSQRSSRPDSRLPPSNQNSTGMSSNYQQGSIRESHVGQSPSSTPKPSPRSRGGAASAREPSGSEQSSRERERDSYVNGNGGGGGSGYQSSSSRRGGQYPNLEHMEGVSSGVISTPAPVAAASQQQHQSQLINMPNAPFLLQNPQLYGMIVSV